MALAACCFATPIFFALGATGFVWSLPAALMTVVLARSKDLKIPRGAAPLLLLIVWIGFSVLRVSDMPTLFLFVYRYTLWISLAACLIWIVNVPVERFSSERVVSWLSVMWMIFIWFGYMALLLPRLNLTSPVQILLPESLLANNFLRELTEIRFAEYQEFLSFRFARPAAPFTYANGWGSAIGILTPLFVYRWIVTAKGQRRRFGVVMVLVGFVPIVMSLNRGLWASLLLGFGYLALLQARKGKPGMLLIVGFVGALAVGAVLVTPLGDSVKSRLDSTEDSNADRENVIVEAFEETLKSPLLGYAQPQQREGGLPVGTHGLVWYTMFSHGFPALLLLVWWMFDMFRRTARRSTVIAQWAHVAFAIACFQSLFYGLLPHLPLLGIIAGISIREQVASRKNRRELVHA